MKKTTDAILMASGHSRRFQGENKLLQIFNGKPLVWHTLSLVSQMDCFQTIAFVYHHPEVGKIAQEFPVKAIHNPNSAIGVCESIRLGVEASSADYYLFLTCDQPLLSSDILASLIQQAAPGCFVQPAYNGKPGNPVLFSSLYRQELLCLQPGERGRTVVQRHLNQLRTVPIKNPWALEDTDTPEKFAQLQEIALKI